MSKNNPTPAEKRRKTSLSKTDINTLIGIILRKDSKEKEYKTKIANLQSANDEYSKKLEDTNSQITVLTKQLKSHDACHASVNKVQKASLEFYKSKSDTYMKSSIALRKENKKLRIEVAISLMVIITMCLCNLFA